MRSDGIQKDSMRDECVIMHLKIHFILSVQIKITNVEYLLLQILISVRTSHQKKKKKSISALFK